MASSKNKLTEDQLVEGIISTILKSIFSRRTKKVFKALEDNPALRRATDDFIDSSAKLDRALRKYGVKNLPIV